MSPSWSVVIPTLNRPDALQRCLQAVASMTPPAEGFEIIVVDDGGTADLSFVRHVPGARLLRQENRGPAAARNAGLRAAKGARVAFTDDDCRPAADWLLRLDAALEEQPDALAGGSTRNAVTGNIFSAASQDVVDFLSRNEPFFASNNLAAAAERLRETGAFDERYRLAAGEDRELARAWVAAGRPLRYVAAAVVDHHHDLRWRSYWRQHVRYGRGAYLFRKSGQSRDAAPKLQPVVFYLNLLLQPLRSERAGARLTRSALLLVAQAATAAGFAAEMMSSRKTLAGASSSVDGGSS